MSAEKGKSCGWLPSSADYPQNRLFCLDLLRGIDMIVLAALYGILTTGGKLCGAPDWWFRNLSHPWGGFTVWDSIMPLFIFMCGAAIPLSVGRRFERGESKWSVWRHVLARFAMLWFFGMLSQGQLASLDILQISPYNNTLQTIAIGYLIAVLVRQVPKRWFWVVAAVSLAALYGLLMHFCGDYSPQGNCAYKVEIWILNRLLPEGSKAYPYGYTWFLTSLMFGSMTLCGMLTTDVLQSGLRLGRKLALLGSVGAGLALAGLGLEKFVPCIKQFFSVSFTAQAMGYDILILAALYVLTDVWRIRRGMGVLLLYGQYALAAYMLSHFFRPLPDALANTLHQGVPHLLGGAADVWMPFVHAVFYAVCITFLLAVHRRLKLFAKGVSA